MLTPIAAPYVLNLSSSIDDPPSFACAVVEEGLSLNVGCNTVDPRVAVEIKEVTVTIIVGPDFIDGVAGGCDGT